MISWILSVLRLASVGAAVSAFLYFIGGMPIRWSITLAFGFALLEARTHYVAAWIRVKPYRLRVSINTPLILEELGFSPSEDDESDGAEEHTYPELRPGLFARLDKDASLPKAAEEFIFYELRPGLWGRSDSVRYSSFIQVRRSVDSIRLVETKALEHGHMLTQHPIIFFKLVEYEWFKLFLLLPRGWKDDATKQFPNATVKEVGDGVLVELAAIPAEYLKHMRRALEISYTSRWKKRDAKWHKTLRGLSWETSEYTDGISHKFHYMSISVHEV
jgi:hypothetical protein